MERPSLPARRPNAGAGPGRCGICLAADTHRLFCSLSIEQWLSSAHSENTAQKGVGRTGEVKARDRHTRMRRINGDDGLIELEIAIPVVEEGRPIGSDVG